MDIFVVSVLCLAGMAFTALVSFWAYASLPRLALSLAETHGRYAGLGEAPPVTAPTAGRLAPVDTGSLQQAA